MIFTIIIILFANLQVYSASADSVYAEYCFQKEKHMKLKLIRELKKIESISIANVDSVECSENSNFARTKTLFYIPTISDSSIFEGLSGGVVLRQRCTTKIKYDTIIKKIVDETMDCYFYDETVKYSSDINIEFPKEKSFTLENDKDLSLEYMQQFVNKNYLAEWKLKVECRPQIDTTYSGSYYIRITGECKEKDLEEVKGE